MKIGILDSSILMSNKFRNRIYAPKDIFISLVTKLTQKKHQIYAYTSFDLKKKINIVEEIVKENKELENKNFISIKDVNKIFEVRKELNMIRLDTIYQLDLISKAFSHAKKNNLDLIHSQTTLFPHFFIQFIDIPVIFTLHDPVFPENTLEYFILKSFNSHNYVAISYSQAESYKKKLNIFPIAVIHHGINTHNFSFSKKSKNFIAMIGRYIPEKGFKEGIEAAKKLKIELKIASSENYKTINYYKKEILPHIDNKNIIEINFLDLKRKNKLLTESKLFLFPIQWEEPFGLVMIESMACGTPVVAFARGSVPEIIKDGVTGYIVNSSPTDIRGNWIVKKTGIEGLCEAIERIYSMPEKEYQEMRYNSRKHVEKYFTVERMVDDYIKVYEEVIKKNKG